MATNATPEQIRPLFRRARIIGRRFQLVHVVFGQEIIETSTFRAPASEDQETDEHGRILRDNVFGSQAEDAARRDFTMNALYYDPHTEEVIDYHHGVSDLKKRQIRMIGDSGQALPRRPCAHAARGALRRQAQRHHRPGHAPAHRHHGGPDRERAGLAPVRRNARC